jgi:hypothetical protein
MRELGIEFISVFFGLPPVDFVAARELLRESTR